jgi:hypothetical protein
VVKTPTTIATATLAARALMDRGVFRDELAASPPASASGRTNDPSELFSVSI